MYKEKQQFDKTQTGKQKDRTFRNLHNDHKTGASLAGTLSGLSSLAAFSGVNAISNENKLHPEVCVYIDLDTGKITGYSKKYEFAKGPITCSVIISSEKGKKQSVYDSETGQTSGDLLSTEQIGIVAGLSKEILTDYQSQGTEILKTREQGGLLLSSTSCEYAFEKPPGISATNRAFIKEVSIPMYQKMRSAYISTFDGESVAKNVWDIKGAVFACVLSAKEAGYGSESAYKKAKDNGNYFGIGGASHFVNTGAKNAEEGFAYWVDYLDKGFKKNGKRNDPGWKGAVKLLESGDFTADKMNKELRSGRHYNSSGPYNTDPNTDPNYFTGADKKTKAAHVNYAGHLIAKEMMKNFVLRFAAVLKEEITALATDKSDGAKYKTDLYNAILCELGTFLSDDYPSLEATKDDYDAK